ncbi:DUF1700 domain-containing protein [Clostridium sp. MSJ-11]|uniref:DUF1700 domain-containing protein n=1 Tax=Clostridium mobile TaxID=2841512 RepID=A0ABS6EL26_9CLOT|nr:DUF1700 domain-containing protein [Clostridium mobile]MBU5485914.1 DUF1700 domain-containing protein [Clostridium mobile]
MNKVSYLEQLEKSLGNLPKNYRNDILKDYYNHFEEGILIGKSEEEISSNLGDVNVIARNIISEYHAEHSDQVKNTKNNSSKLFAIANIIIGIFNMLAIVPLILSISLLIITLYILAYILLTTPVFLILHWIFPSLPINIGFENYLVQLVVTALCTALGYYLHKLLKTYTGNYFKWVSIYLNKSVKFQILSNGYES